MLPSRPVLALLAVPLALAGCGSPAEPIKPGDPPFPTRVVVTADWLNRSLTVFDYARLVDGAASVAEARWATIDLAAYPPGPLEVELTPDGRTAVVSVGPGFFGGSVGALFLGQIDVPAGGSLLLVDLPSRSVRAKIATAQVPMGIAITPDGSRAFTANFGQEGEPGHTISVIDLAKGTIVDEVTVAGQPEQIALRGDGSLGIVAIDGEATVRTFDPADLAHTLSSAVSPAGDPSGVALVDETHLGVVADSLGPLGYSVIDVSNPLSPQIVDTVSKDFGVPYAATRIPGTKHVLLGGATGAPASLLRVDLGATPAVEVDTIPLSNARGGFALGAAVDREGRHAFVAVPGDNSLQVVDLEAKAARSLKWLPATGPTYAAVAP
jgi:DNA-binding beta-propeller fold protein YncE